MSDNLGPAIEYFYSAHSAFAYLGSARLMEIARGAGRKIIHRPVDLRLVVDEAGSTPFGKRSAKHRNYYFRREIERWSEERDAPVMDGIPTWHGNDIGLVNCMLIAGIEQGLIVDQFAHHLLKSHWLDDADLADRDTLARLANDVDVDPAPLLEAALSTPVRAIYEANTAEAIQRSVFGSPTYFVDGDMFYGQDRLEQVARALKKPYAGDWP